MNSYVTLKQFIVALFLVTAISTFTATQIASVNHNTQSRHDIQQRYVYDTQAYIACVTRQNNTKSGNERALVLKKFLAIAASARTDAAKQFQQAKDPEQAAVNFATANKEYRLRSHVQLSTYTFCAKPPTPEGVKQVALPPAPYNNLATDRG